MTPRLRKTLSVAAVVGGVAGLLSFTPSWPKERVVDFRFEDDASEIVRLDVSWSHFDQAAGTDPVSGSSFRFEPGHAPKIIHSTVHLPDGSYALDITLERADRTTSIRRELTLGDADRITVPLR